MVKKGRFGLPESRGPKYYCFLCQGGIDSPIQACPKHEPELHRKLTDSRKKREMRDRPDREDARPPEKKPREVKPEEKKE
ncbi:MAG: hypothetical protein ACYS8W_20395 [Planctomycetota bacterium]|jgi:hypothetical protein